MFPETDDRRAAATLQMVDAYEAQQDFVKAEELLVDLWSRLTDGMCKFIMALQFSVYGDADYMDYQQLIGSPRHQSCGIANLRLQ